MQEIDNETHAMLEQLHGMKGAIKAEMPQYGCHKKVWALKIRKIHLDHEDARREGRETDGHATITPEEPGYAPLKVDRDYLAKHEPVVGGYYVVYADGYTSFSPAKAFEDGYTRI